MRAAFLLLLGVVASAGCGPSIGDSCMSNIDCSFLGDRFCDTAPQGGYCTLEDCDLNMMQCPSEAVCIRFFTPLADEPCTFDPSLPFTQADCAHIDDRCVCDVTDAKGVCVDNAGHCAPSASERHWCQKKCSHDSDCRTGYECRSTGTFGAEPLPSFGNGNGEPAKFCAPKPTTF